jgi:hypothetical protein
VLDGVNLAVTAATDALPELPDPSGLAAGIGF